MPFSNEKRGQLKSAVIAIENAAIAEARTHRFDEWNPFVRRMAGFPLYHVILKARELADDDYYRDVYSMMYDALQYVSSVIKTMPAELVALFDVLYCDADGEEYDDNSDLLIIKAALLNKCLPDNGDLAIRCNELADTQANDPNCSAPFNDAVSEGKAHYGDFTHDKCIPLMEQVASNPWMTPSQIIELLCVAPYPTKGHISKYVLLNQYNRHPKVAAALEKDVNDFREFADCLADLLCEVTPIA